MSERLERARRLAQQVDAGWQRQDVEAQLARLAARQRWRARRWAVAVPLATAALAAAVAVIVVGRPAAVAPVVAVPAVAIERPAPIEAPPAMAPAPAPIAPVAPAPTREGHAHPPAIVAHPAPPIVRAEVPAAPAAPSWRDDAERGDYAAAWAGLAQVQDGLDGMADLLLAGDVARLSGHPTAAVAPLARALAHHADDPRAQLAAFTLGRVYLEELGAPRDAAVAFARARELAPAGPLTEDALAREVEAWSRAGETATARTQALLYVQRYPTGRRAHAVRRFGGLERP